MSTTASHVRATPSLQELADGVFAYVQPDGGWCVNNSGFVVNGPTSMLVDTAATESRTRRLRDTIRPLAPGGPNLLVNTHHHGDHHFGNGQFAPSATIVAHEQARVEMAEAGLGLRHLWPDVEWGDTPLTLPTVTFRDTLTVHAGDLRVELIHVGPAHTTNDVVVWIPQHRVLFAGDVVMSGTTPFCLMGSVEGALRAISRLRDLDPAVVVPGHGPVGGSELFDADEDYLRWVQHLVAEGVRAGWTPLQTARAADTGRFAHLLDAERIVGNLHRGFAEATTGAHLGGPIDLLAGFQEMVGFHGRLPDCHA